MNNNNPTLKSSIKLMLILVFLLNSITTMFGHVEQGRYTYKGVIGKYTITMQLSPSSCSSSNPDIFPVAGVYWYGNGKNGKLILRGTLVYNQAGIGIYRLTEYDQKGKHCGSFILYEQEDINTCIKTITGSMTNLKGTTFNVKLKGR